MNEETKETEEKQSEEDQKRSETLKQALHEDFIWEYSFIEN